MPQYAPIKRVAMPQYAPIKRVAMPQYGSYINKAAMLHMKSF
ncbi:hypothetical protein [Clostridium sp. YIM B02555]|nr:hypothetical protein [Clostridium sp. YIM B02555]